MSMRMYQDVCCMRVNNRTQRNKKYSISSLICAKHMRKKNIAD